MQSYIQRIHSGLVRYFGKVGFENSGYHSKIVEKIGVLSVEFGV